MEGQKTRALEKARRQGYPKPPAAGNGARESIRYRMRNEAVLSNANKRANEMRSCCGVNNGVSIPSSFGDLFVSLLDSYILSEPSGGWLQFGKAKNEMGAAIRPRKLDSLTFA